MCLNQGSRADYRVMVFSCSFTSEMLRGFDEKTENQMILIKSIHPMSVLLILGGSQGFWWNVFHVYLYCVLFFIDVWIDHYWWIIWSRAYFTVCCLWSVHKRIDAFGPLYFFMNLMNSSLKHVALINGSCVPTLQKVTGLFLLIKLLWVAGSVFIYTSETVNF